MNILFTSDLHGYIAAYTRFSEILSNKKYDVGIISGDLVSFSHNKLKSENHIKEILHQANKRIFFIMGNDDGVIGHDWSDTTLLLNPNLKKIKYEKINFVGYQYTNPVVGGPFEKTGEEQMKDLPQLIELIDSNTIFISHGPPYGILDQVYDKQHVGSVALRKLVERKKPIFHLFGHIHEAHGIHGNSINGAYPILRKFVSIDLTHHMVNFVE